MRRRLLVVLLAVAVALAAAGAAAAANGGFTPQFAHSPNTEHTNTAYYVILGFTSAIFLVVESALVVFIWRFRSRGRARTVEGMQVHGNTRLELIWTVLPVVILAIIGTVVFVELPKITQPANAASSVDIKVEGHQFYWKFDYPNGATTIGTLYVPVGQDVRLTVVSDDVVHSFWVPQLAGKIQAIPGRVNHTGFKANRAGTYNGYCAELCGPFHAAMLTTVVALPADQYQAALAQHTTPAELGRTEFQGVCATCHGMQGQGGYGKVLQTSSLVTQESAVAQIVRNGRNKMPPVGNSWSDAQIADVVAYMKAHIYKGATPSGG